VLRAFDGVQDADEVDVDDAEVGLFGVGRVGQGKDRVIARYASVGDDNVNSVLYF
jgi:hypothetical protein